jgi:predicted lipid-binding transport protein (Tim44 family)
MSETFDPTIIIFAVLAVFVVWKLRSVLGTRTGRENPPSNPFEGKKTDGPVPARTGNVVRLPGAAADEPVGAPGAGSRAPDRWKGFAEPDSQLWKGFDALADADSSFQPGPFLDGAKSAYEMVVSAYATGDRITLGNLLSKEVFDSFASAITAREQRGETAESTFVSMDSATIEDVQTRGNTAQITVRFKANLINATRDKAGNVVDGDPEKVVSHVDLWTFARDTGSRDPNWKLIATDSPA